ncbi:prepilin-type N-terminal cleavage/methylation domain-containing protein [Mameliella alba]|nr:prepilin-type N-terminal cleavage/methylation domain-containing protein [Mameliella alba]MBY6171900.1 prepilin-type N-terminal cleavage/methylation domain-containing protein [Mameliella alba]MBY6176028.1 prepilin-type N-terminal cleavage/methylation domain-containing protein [Mameliella alba]
MDAGLRSGDAGFSLLEVMVSVAVLAVLAVGVGLSTGGAVTGAERDAQRFRQAFQQTWALAVMARAEHGLEVTPTEVRLSRRGPEGWEPGQLLHEWRGRASLVLSAPLPLQGPPIRLGADGRASAFTVTFRTRGTTWRCISDGWSDLTCAEG